MTTSDKNRESTNGDVDDRPGVAYVLIREGISLTSFDQLGDNESVESRVSRARGGGKLNVESTNKTPDADNIYNVKLGEGKIGLDTGYLMHFVDPSLRDLTAYDVVSLPENTAYPVPEHTIESLPEWALSKLQQKGHIKLSGEYDRDNRMFRDVQSGWEKYHNPYDRLVDLTEAVGGDMLAAAYYLISKHATERYAHPETIAQARNIQKKSVKDGIKRIEKLDEAE